MTHSKCNYLCFYIYFPPLQRVKHKTPPSPLQGLLVHCDINTSLFFKLNALLAKALNAEKLSG